MPLNRPDAEAQQACGADVAPFLRWAGSKRKVVPYLASFWTPSFRRYVEPFAGSAALFFKLQPAKAILSDINEGLIETYEVVRDRPDDLHEAVTKIARSEKSYYRVRSREPSRLAAFDRAVRFVFLNRNCFNGIFRTNTQGEFNVPYAHARPGATPTIENFRRCSRLLQGASLRCGDFGEVLSSTRAGDFIYLDPPYAVESRRVFREYDQRQFSHRDLERLAAHLTNLDRKGASFILSYADCHEARDLLSRWQRRRIRVRRNVAGFVSARRVANELFFTNIQM